MSNAVLDFARSQDPELNNADDDALTLFLGDKDPGFLDDAQFAERYSLVKEKRKVEGGTPVADFVSKASDYLTPFVYGMSARGAISTLAWDIGAAGQLAGATTEALAKVQQAGSFKAATTPLPEIEDRVVVQAARGIGELAPALGAMAVGVPAPVALGAGMGANEFSRSGDVTRTLKAVGTGLAFPAVGEIGSVGGELLAGRVAVRLGLGEAATGAAMTAGKVVGAQSMYTALMVAGESEHFAELLHEDPEKAREELTKMMLVNLVFEVPRLPQLAREALARDHVQAWFKSPDYREVLDTIKSKEMDAGRDVGQTVEVPELPAPEAKLIEAAKPLLPRAAAEAEGVGQFITIPAEEVRRIATEQVTPEIPLGLNRAEAIDPALSKLGEAEFDAVFRNTTKEVERLETLYDEGKPFDRQALAEAQDRFSAAGNERFRRNIQDIVPEDLFTKLRREPNDTRASIILSELERQGATTEQMLSETRLRSPDESEVFRGQLERIKRLRKAQPEPIEPEAQGAIATPGPALQPAPASIPLLTPKSQRQIITDLAKGLKLPIRFGRLRTNKYAGYFLKVQNLIGSKEANDIPVVTHEVGHKLDSTFGFASDPTLRAELDALGDPAMPGSRSSWTPSKTLAYKRAEGVAEFVRHWLIDPPNAARLAPNMLRQFEATLNANKDFGDTMRQAQSDIQVWRNAAPQARLRSHISVGENPNKTPYTLSQLTRDLVDDLHFLRLAVDDAKQAGGDLPPSQNPYLLARTLRGSYGMADSFISKGVADFNSKAVTLGTSLEAALKPVAGRIPDFRDWIMAKRAQELHRQGRQTGLVDSDVQATVAQFDRDATFQTAFTKVKEWQDAVLQYAVDSGFVTTEGAAAMRQMNHDYVPLHRVFEIGAGESPAEGSGTGRGLNVGTPGSLKRLKGSSRDIVDPIETMVRNAYAIITASEKHAINRAVADLSRKPDMGKWVEHIATPKESVKVGMEKIRKQLEDAGADLTNVPDDLLLQFFQNSKTAPFGENIIKVVRDGKPEFYRLKRELFETFHALDVEDSGTLIRMLSAPAQVLRAGVTVAPDFALANALRDAFTSAIVSRHGLFPFEAVVRGVGALLRNPKLVAEWQAAGGKNSIEASYFDRDKLQRFLAEKITKDLTTAERALIVVKSPLQALRWLTSLSEEATRIGEYQKAFSDLVRGGMPEGEARRLAAYESRDRQDFAKGGAKTKIPRRLAAFWNAGVQGNVRLAQAFKENPIPTTLRGIAFITIPKLLEQAVNWDDEDYWDRPQWERDLFFLIPAGKGSDGHTRFIRIPTPFEAGVIFGTLPGRILQTIREKDPEAAKTFPLLLTKQTIPNPTPQWALTIFEDFMVGKNGWDVYRQRPIVPRSLEQLPADMQWTEQTSLTARKLGASLGFSPMKIDHIINSTTGGLGRQTTHQIVDRVIEAATGDKRTAKGAVPGGRFVTTPAVVSSQAIEDFYQTLDKIKTAAAGEKKGRDSDLVEWQKQFSRVEKELADLRKEMREAASDTEKNVIAEEILFIARETMKDFNGSKSK